MAKVKRKWNLFLPVLLSASIILAGGICYINSMQYALWNKAVMDILEVTAQGRHALDTYIEKDQEMLHLLTEELSMENSRNQASILQKMGIPEEDGTSYFCIDLDDNIVYSDMLEEGYAVEAAQIDPIRKLDGKGFREPFLEGRTGVWATGVYEHFTFADGVKGYVQKTQPLSIVAERFSLSFYHDTGFSYVVNREGDIQIRSQHRNSNRAFHNLFDIIDLQGNNEEEIKSFRRSMESGNRGAARFHYQEEDYVFCYVPMETVEGWYVVSIIPNQVIMEQAHTIIYNSMILFLVILTSILVAGAIFMVYRDSTRRVLLAEENARKAAESANVAKSRFLSNMSHDIRTPMNAIIGMTKLASDHLEEPEKVREYLKNIGLSGQLLVGLINDILDMSKIESGKMALNADNASLEELLGNLVSITQPTVKKKHQQFEIRLHGVEHEVLCFDSLRLNQVMLNLLSNAVKFTPENGSISVDVTESPSLRENCAHFTFCVSDTGIGMKPEFLHDIFNSFTREQDSRVNHIEGSGLGMAITKMIVDMMEGTIVVDSIQGKGSTFTVDLDLSLPIDPPQDTMSLPHMRILVADDDPATCQSAEEFLSELGVSADTAENGQVAVEKAMDARDRGESYQLILLDWKMPDMNGVEAVRAIREKTGNEIPVLIFSAYDWACIEIEAVEAGVNGFIQKPFFKSTLYRCIRKYVMQDELSAESFGESVTLAGKRILLAEDNELNQQIAQELLTNAGAQVVTVDNGLLCVERFEQSEPGEFDLILMDIQMPVMNGYDATRRIRSLERPDAAVIPIFAMTADAFAEDIEEAKKAGMDCHLAKPLDIPAMMREIQKYLKTGHSGIL